MAEVYEKIKTDIIAMCRRLLDLDYFIGTWGNISVRVPEGFIVTPSRIDYHDMTPSDMVTLSLDGRVLSGHRLPSSETEIHRSFLQKKPEINAAIHSHSVYATAVSCLHSAIPVIVEEVAQVVGGEVPCTQYVPAGQHKKIAAEVASTVGEGNALLMANHGVVCGGRDLEEALLVCRIVEKAARMMLAAAPVGRVIEIPREYTRSERERYLYKYGTAEDSP